MSSLGERLDAAIKASKKSREEIATEAETTVDTISRITTGKHDNPELQLLVRLAAAAKTKVGTLLGESIDISPEDEDTLLDVRRWIDSKLVTIDARAQPNAVIARSGVRELGAIADHPRAKKIANPFDDAVTMELRAIGESMIDAGILPDDLLYAIAPGDLASSIGKIVACRIGQSIFVKRLAREHRRLYLVSEHPRYKPIAVSADSKAFEILGVVIGRVGSVD
jgi:transcriptional regulator with XRE-family HTH domain